jgi:hypothetical protein
MALVYHSDFIHWYNIQKSGGGLCESGSHKPPLNFQSLEQITVKNALRFILLLTLLLTACSSASTQTAKETSPAPSTIPTQKTLPSITPEPGMVSAEPGCTVVSPAPTPGPTLQAMFPNASEADWRRGPLTAAVTIMEYSDFQ